MLSTRSFGGSAPLVGLLIIWLDVKPIITITITINKINHIT